MYLLVPVYLASTLLSDTETTQRTAFVHVNPKILVGATSTRGAPLSTGPRPERSLG
jgi:hypothetical protein